MEWRRFVTDRSLSNWFRTALSTKGLPFGRVCRKRSVLTVFTVLLLGMTAGWDARASQPRVAIHDSELTRAMESVPGSDWPANWHYFVLPESVQEALRSDGTAFQVVSDSDISGGQLLDAGGKPRYPIVISLGAAAIADNEIARFTNYVAAGGFLFIGSSSFTHNPDGTARADFAFATQLGLHMSNPSDSNFADDRTFEKTTSHRLTAHIPDGVLTWRMPEFADEISWPIPDHPTGAEPFGVHLIWQVTADTAQVIAQGDAGPYLLVKPYGNGYFIYDAALQPLIGHGGWAPGMYAYGIFRNAIQWAFEAARMPVPKVSPWPFNYDAAVIFRHDCEAIPAMITSIEESAQFENSVGAKGDYFFCTGALREDIPDTNSAIASLKRAITLYGATIGPHNGGLTNPNPYDPPLALLESNLDTLIPEGWLTSLYPYILPPLNPPDYDYWHWSPDELLDTVNLPAPFADGRSYALTSMSNSFTDLKNWGLTNSSGRKIWVAPYFNATRDGSYQIEEQLHIVTAGEQKLSPFPHWTLSTETSGKRYPVLTLPVSDWYLDSAIAQSMENGHTITSVHELVDAYYNLGALINIYSHSSSAGDGKAGQVATEYVTYSLSKPKVWSANTESVYSWWLTRTNVQITPSYTDTGAESIATFLIAGATDSQTSVELVLPDLTPNAVANVSVLLNNLPANPSSFRLSGQTLKILVGTTVTKAEVHYTIGPKAVDDRYSMGFNAPLVVPAPGVLANDTGTGGTLTAVQVTSPAHGSVALNSDGSFTYIPNTGFIGSDQFTYQTSNGSAVGNVATVRLTVTPAGAIFYDDLTRDTDPGSLDPWTPASGAWQVSSGVLEGSSLNDYGRVYIDTNWTDYSVEAQIQFSSTLAWGGGIGGRLDAVSGAHYAAWVYPEGSLGGSSILQLFKFNSFSTGSSAYTLMAKVSLPGVGTSAHVLKMTFQGNRILVFYDGTQQLNVIDNGTIDGQPAYLQGGILAEMYTDSNVYSFTLDNVDVSVAPVSVNDSYVTSVNTPLNVSSPGVLANDADSSGRPFTAVLVSGPSHGTLTLHGNGSFSYVPAADYFGLDEFNYKASDGVLDGNIAAVTIEVSPAGGLLFDNFTRSTDPGPLSPWVVANGTWSAHLGALSGAGAQGSYSHVYVDTNWTDYTVQASIRFSDSNAWGAGLGGRLNAASGAHYAAWVYPNGSPSPSGARAVNLFKFSDYTTYQLMAHVILPQVGTNAHNLAMSFRGNEILIYYDGVQVIDASDDGGFPLGPALASGGISVDMYTDFVPYTFFVDDVQVLNKIATVTLSNLSQVYDGTPRAPSVDTIPSGLTVNLTYNGSSTVPVNAGSYQVVATVVDSFYTGQAAGTLTVAPRGLTVAAVADTRLYNGNTGSTATPAITSGSLATGDTAAFVQSFDNRNVGAGKTLTATGVVNDGNLGHNYSVTFVKNVLGVINQAPLTISAVYNTKTYDRTTDAAATPSVSGLQDGDTVTGLVEIYDSPAAGTGKTLSVTAYTVNDGNAGGNYAVSLANNTTGVINPRALTVTASGMDKLYDGTTAATVTLSDNKLAGDTITDNYASAAFADKTMGSGKTVNVSGISITGADAGNYALQNTTASTSANITARALTVSATGVDKVYDGTAVASVTLSDNRVAGDQLSASYTGASFGDKSVANNKTVSVSGVSISGIDAGNYTLQNTAASATANITARTLTVSATGVDKMYDGTTGATVNLSDNKVSGDAVSESYGSAAFANKNVGNGKTVSVSGVTISGGDASNYSLQSTTASTTASITSRPLTVSATGVDKVYDGMATASVVLSDNKVVGDAVTDSYTIAAFGDKVIGTSKAVSVSGISISGADAGNYSLQNTSASTTANITGRPLTVSATGVNKVYDGTTVATVTLSDNRLAGDQVTESNTGANFANKNVGNGKAVSVSGISISGTDAGNYILQNTSAATTANITARSLTVTAAGVNKVYDGTITATATLSDNRLSGDVFTDAYTSAAFGDKNVGTNKTVSVTGISITGTDGGNYSLLNTSASTSANITSRPLTVNGQRINKIYDGTTNATTTLTDNRVPGDSLSTSYISAFFNDKNIGKNKVVTVTGISISGPDAGNYSLQNTTDSIRENIAARALTVTASGVNKVYDRTVNATVNLTDDSVSGDQVIDTYTAASFPDKNVGANKPVTVSGIAISGTDAGNYLLQNTATNTTASITARPLTVSASALSKIYDGTTAATVTLSDNKISGDVVTDVYTAAAFNDKNIGTGKTVNVTGISISGADAGNYALQSTTASTTANITGLGLTVTASGVNKVYDGTTVATVTFSDNRLAGDQLTAGATGANFADKNKGNNKAVTVSGISISGPDAGNYTLQNTSAATTANITVRGLTVSASGVNKVYDGTSSATVNLSDNKVSGDAISESYSSAAFGDKNVGTGKPVSVTGISMGGNDAGNYALQNTSAATTANITARSLTVSASGVNKVYDGTSSATVNLSDDKVSGDAVTESYISAAFGDKNVGTGKVVTVSGISISGNDVGNYALQNTGADTSAAITARPLTVSATGVDKMYDGSASASVHLSDDKVTGDDLSEGYSSASFSDKNVGIAKNVSVNGIGLSGGDAGNYALQNTSASTSASITARPLTVSANGINKTYDGTTTATVTLSDNKVPGDAVVGAYTSAAFSDKSIGTGKAVSVSGVSISGADAGNYALQNTTASTTANITGRALTVSATGVDKVYDRTTAASVTLSDDRVAGDQLSANYTGASFSDKNVGTSKTVSVSGVSISGADAGNYTLQNTTASTTANITAKALTVSATGVDKVYDGTAMATVNLSDGKVLGDVVMDSYTVASFGDKTVGSGKAVSVSGLSISGADAGNYALQNTTASTTANITAKPLTVSATGVNKVYDGTTGATVNLSDDKISGDAVTDAYASAVFNDKAIGTGKAVSVSGVSISGADAGNYALQNTTASTTADITGRALTVSATGVDKVYDGTTAASVTLSDDRVAGDQLSANYTGASFSDKNVGASKSVSVSGVSIGGNDAANYTLQNTTASTTASITARALTVSATGVNKVYDGTTTATVTLSDNRVAGDSLTETYTGAAFTDKNVGPDKTISVTGISISGIDSANYTANSSSLAAADITPASLTVVADNLSKHHGTANPPLSFTETGFVSGEDSSAISGSPALSTTATEISPAGTYPITIEIGTLSALNYAFNLVEGVLTITNLPPVLPAQADRSLVDLTTLTVINTATDPDVPPSGLTYQLQDPPSGATITAGGVITWTPTLAQSPSTNILTTIVTDNSVPPLSATNSFAIIVTGAYDGIDFTDPAQALADPDQDGIANLLEYALGTDPHNPADAQHATVISIMEDAGGQYVTLQFKRRKLSAGLPLQYIPEVSGDHQTWYSDAGHVLQLSVTTLDAQFDSVTVRDITPTTSSVPRFIRLRVSEN